MSSLRNNLVVFILCTLGFQQVLVINIGGSLKIYEVATFFLFLIFLAQTHNWKVSNKESIYLLCLMIISPILSLILFYTSNHNLSPYYLRFPEANTLRYNSTFAPIIALIYSILCWIAFNEISKSVEIFEKRLRIYKLIILYSTLIALYSLYSSILSGLFGWPDLISKLPELIQRKGSQDDFGIRSTGFSQEPSFYIFFQSWNVLILYGIRRHFKTHTYIMLLSINCASLLLTFSTSILALAAALIIAITTTSSSRTILKFSFFLFVIFAATAFSINYHELNHLFNYYFQDKLLNFLFAPSHTLDSGSFRAYTSALGIEIFKDYPIFGAGLGVSNFLMHAYENNIQLNLVGIQLGVGEVPQSTYAKILAEQGIIGFFAIIFFQLTLTKRIFIEAKNDEFSKILLAGVIFTWLILLSIQPQYSLFIWAYTALAANYCIFHNKNHNLIVRK